MISSMVRLERERITPWKKGAGGKGAGQTAGLSRRKCRRSTEGRSGQLEVSQRLRPQG